MNFFKWLEENTQNQEIAKTLISVDMILTEVDEETAHQTWEKNQFVDSVTELIHLGEYKLSDNQSSVYLSDLGGFYLNKSSTPQVKANWHKVAKYITFMMQSYNNSEWGKTGEVRTGPFA